VGSTGIQGPTGPTGPQGASGPGMSGLSAGSISLSSTGLNASYQAYNTNTNVLKSRPIWLQGWKSTPASDVRVGYLYFTPTGPNGSFTTWWGYAGILSTNSPTGTVTINYYTV